MNVDPGVVYIFISAILALQGWNLKETVGVRSRLHRLEARETFLNSEISKLENKMSELEHKMSDIERHLLRQ